MHHRRRLVAAAVLLIAIAAAVVLATRGDAAPADTTAALVPADAVAYAHLSTAESRTQDARLRALAGRFAVVRTQLPKLAAALTPGAGALSYARDVQPWIGDDAAFALLASGEPMLVASVRDRAAAERMLGRLGATSAGTYKATALKLLRPSATAAFVQDHLVVGPAAEVRAAIDRAAGAGTPALAKDRLFRRAAKDRTGAASLEVYAPSAGLRRLLAGRDGIAGVAASFVAEPSLEAVEARFAAEETGVRVDARLLHAPGGRPDTFTPTLARRVEAGSAGFLALPGMDAVERLVRRLGATAAVTAIEDALPKEAGLELDDVVAPLSGEAQLTIAGGDGAPVFTLAARTRDEASTRESLARLQEPIGRRLAGGAPFTQFDRGRTPAFALPVTPQLEPTYAVSRGAVVASTARSGLSQLDPAKSPVTEASALKEVIPSEDAKVEALGFLDSRQLLALAERTGLRALSSPAVRDDLGRIRTAGAVVEEDGERPTDTTAELFLQIP